MTGVTVAPETRTAPMTKNCLTETVSSDKAEKAGFRGTESFMTSVVPSTECDFEQVT